MKTTWLSIFNKKRVIVIGLIITFCIISVMLIIGKTYQKWDNDTNRGAISSSLTNTTPIYLDQGWTASDSLWFYNTTQGSGLLPYDFYMVLEQSNSSILFRDNDNINRYGYLPQKSTFFNPDGLSVGFTMDQYKGKSYMGYTCAACHTSQIDFGDKSIRIDGGPSSADMISFLYDLEHSLKTTLEDNDKRKRFVKAVIDRNGDYSNKQQVIKSLTKWTQLLQLYNTVNHSEIDYGFSRMDAFGRIYNRVIQHVINKEQASESLLTTTVDDIYMLSIEQVELVLDGINPTVIGNKDFAVILERLQSNSPGYPNLNQKQILAIRDNIFNEPNAPVSYSFLWDIVQSDYVQWNGIATNSGAGPLGRNVGEAIGVFGILDWQASEPGFNIAAYLSGQSKKTTKQIQFTSSVNLTNLKRLESHLRSLKSPKWPQQILGNIDDTKTSRGKRIYGQYCQSCHEIIKRDDWDRIIVGKFISSDIIGTDSTMSDNSVNYTGKSGNFKYTYQNRDGVGDIVIGEQAPVAMLLTSVVTGTIGTPDVDKNIIRRWFDWGYTMAMTFIDNDIQNGIRQGQYLPDTTVSPFQSLLSYKARPLNGIWATAPFLHNGSIPSLYDLFLPKKMVGDPLNGQYRPDTFTVGSRQYDPNKVGFISTNYEGFKFDTSIKGNYNTGHEYAAGKSPQLNGDILPELSVKQKDDLLEFVKTL